MIEFFAITLVMFLAAISPGPDFILVVKNALLRNRKAGIFTALGVSMSLLIHSCYCILGLAIIISQSLFLFSIIKYMGAAYLIYIGVMNLLVKKTTPHPEHEQVSKVSVSLSQVFLEGFLCNLLNPKAILFILAFFTLILNPSTSLFLKVGFAIEIALVHFVWFSFLVIMITHRRVKTNLHKIQHVIIKLMGSVLIAFGAHIALTT